jgi:hypothetical protein
VSAPAGLLARLFGAAPSVRVAATRIFARFVDAGEQALVYSMRLSVAGDVAMILPVPVPPRAGDDALRFVSLEKYPRLFEDVAKGFEVEMFALAKSGGFAPRARPKLVVHEVGAFVASYVPSRGDFDRLDARFRLPDSVWAAMGRYDDWGFAVFQLAHGKEKQVHPMAMRFRTREPARLFFPTVHVHDGRFHPTADFDHELYYQDPRLDRPGVAPGRLSARARTFVRIEDTQGLVDGDLPIARRSLHGTLANEDTWIEPPSHEHAAA